MMKKIFTTYILLFLFAVGVNAQSIVSVDLQKNSTLTIHGSTNVVAFKLVQGGDKMIRRNLSVQVNRIQNKIIVNQAVLSVSVKDFTSDNKFAQRDFRKLMKADEYPNLQVIVQSLDIQPTADGCNVYNGVANLTINITGVHRQYSIPISTNGEGELINVEGKKRLNIRDFGLTPPEEMMGLIHVSEWIDVDFHLICRIKPETSAKL